MLHASRTAEFEGIEGANAPLSSRADLRATTASWVTSSLISAEDIDMRR
jgi:hypothetical protein